LIDPSFEESLHRSIRSKCHQLGCAPLATGGTDDHVHLLARLHPTIALSRLIGEAKGYSSYFVSQRLTPGRVFCWQEGYYAATVSEDALPLVERYVVNQRRHHQSGELVEEFEPPEDIAA
jgi:REP element-mobilizing transposase RayT